jgi:hypothetical protein
MAEDAREGDIHAQQPVMAKGDQAPERHSSDQTDAPSNAPSIRRKTEVDDVEFPTGPKLWLVMISLCLSIFLVALDQTIIAPALGAITNEYNSTKEYAFPELS